MKKIKPSNHSLLPRSTNFMSRGCVLASLFALINITPCNGNAGGVSQIVTGDFGVKNAEQIITELYADA